MKKIIFLVALAFTLSACGDVKAALEKVPLSGQPQSTSTKPQEGVGVLLALKSQGCLVSNGCGSKSSLLAPDMQTRSFVLIGEIDKSMNGNSTLVKGMLTQGLSSAASNMIELGYDGLSGELKSVQTEPEDSNL